MSKKLMPLFMPLLMCAAMATSSAAAPVDEVDQHQSEPVVTYLPNAQNSKIVSVATGGQPAARAIVQTQAVAVKETGPRETVARYGEVYAFAPATIVVHRDEPTLIEFWNLQPDDDHDFMLMDPHWSVMMKVLLPALKKTSYILTFHEEGLFNFVCAMHQPAMSGQILVVAPVGRRGAPGPM